MSIPNPDFRHRLLAPVFEVLERPNDWDRRVQDTAKSGELTKLGQFRRDFWTHVSKRHPGEAPPGYARSNVYGSVEGADRRFSLYLAWNGVGLFFPRERGESPAERTAAVELTVEWLRQETDEELPDDGSSFLRVDSHDRSNWDRMADWLHHRRLLYERALRKVGADTPST